MKITGASALGSDGCGVEAAGEFVNGHNSVEGENIISNGFVRVKSFNDGIGEKGDAEFDVRCALEGNDDVLDFLAEALDAEELGASLVA